MPTKKTTKAAAVKKTPTKKAVKKAVTKKVTKTSTAKKTAKKSPVKKSVTKKVATKKVTKKATKKSPTKKSTTKKPKATTKLLVCAQDGHCFWTTDGQVLRDLNDLKLALGEMDDMVFMHHVSDDKNDFADWVEHVLNDAQCAEALRNCQTPKKATTIVTTHLRYYTI